MFVNIQIDEETGKKRPNFGSTWGAMLKEDANAEAIKTGNGLMVIDIDTKDVSKLDAKLVELLPRVPTVDTARGYHYYFNVNDDSLFKSIDGIFKHVDMKSSGGLVFSDYWGEDTRIKYKRMKEDNYTLSKELCEYLLTSHRFYHKDKQIPTIIEMSVDDKAPIGEVREALSFIPAYDTYSDWLKIGMALNHWDKNDGLLLWDEYSQRCSNYSQKEIISKWSSFGNDGITIATVFGEAIENGYSREVAIHDIPFGDLSEKDKKKVIKERAIHTKLNDWLVSTNANAWFDQTTEKYVIKDPHGITMFSKNGFLQHILSKSGVRLKGSDIKIKSLKSDYRPSMQEFFTEGGQDYANTFIPTKLMDMEGEAEMPYFIGKLFDNLFEDKEQLNTFLNWIACIYKYRIRTGTAWVFAGKQGTGKGILAEEILKEIWKHNMSLNITDSNLSSDFNPYMQDKLLVHFNEVSAESKKSRIEVKNRLKTWITDKSIYINIKSTKEVERANFSNIIINSNEYIPIDIDAGDRRFNVVRTDNVLVEQEWFTRVETVEKIVKEIPDFCRFLNGYDADIKKAKTVYMSELKSELVEAVKTTPELIADALVERNFEFFLDSGLEKWLRKESDFNTPNISTIEMAFDGDFFSNDVLSTLISSVFDRETNMMSAVKLVINKYKLGFKKTVNNKRGWILRKNISKIHLEQF